MKQIRTVYCREHFSTIPLQYWGVTFITFLLALLSIVIKFETPLSKGWQTLWQKANSTQPCLLWEIKLFSFPSAQFWYQGYIQMKFLAHFPIVFKMSKIFFFVLCSKSCRMLWTMGAYCKWVAESPRILPSRNYWLCLPLSCMQRSWQQQRVQRVRLQYSSSDNLCMIGDPLKKCWDYQT